MKIGKRYTQTRKKIFSAIGHFNKPVTAQEIYEYLKKEKENVDLASVYRNLNLMRKSEVINVILFGEGMKRYELKNSNHHHHFFCESCGEIKDVEMNENSLIKSIKNKKGYLIKKHNLEFFGLCPECQ